MSSSQARRNRKAMDKHMGRLGEMLMSFYAFLEKKPQPADEEVREQFIKRNEQWKSYCTRHGLSREASYMFNNEVAISWKQRYTKQNEP